MNAADIFGGDSDDDSLSLVKQEVVTHSSAQAPDSDDSVVLSDLEDNSKAEQQQNNTSIQPEPSIQTVEDDDVTYSSAALGRVRTARLTGSERQSVSVAYHKHQNYVGYYMYMV